MNRRINIEDGYGCILLTKRINEPVGSKVLNISS